MRKIKLSLLSVLVLLMFSCASKVVPIAGYEIIKKTANPISINNTWTKTNVTLVTAKDYSADLKLNDSVLVYSDSLFSNYKTYMFNAIKSKSYKITVSSLCDCFGFKKYMFNPEIYVMNSFGIPVELSQQPFHFGYEKGPLTLTKQWTFNLKAGENYYFTLFSNNKRLQTDIYKFIAGSVSATGGVIVPVVVPINVKSSLVGNYVIKIEEN